MALARIAERRVGECSTQGLANTAWAFASLGHSDERLFDASAAVALWCVSEFKAQGCASLA